VVYSSTWAQKPQILAFSKKIVFIIARDHHSYTEENHEQIRYILAIIIR